MDIGVFQQWLQTGDIQDLQFESQSVTIPVKGIYDGEWIVVETEEVITTIRLNGEPIVLFGQWSSESQDLKKTIKEIVEYQISKQKEINAAIEQDIPF